MADTVPEQSFQNLRVLVIDDDDVVRMALRLVLKKAGCAVMEANNGTTGVAMFKQSGADVVITDILMPDKEGLQTTSEIRAINPGVKIIAMSGGGSTKNMNFLRLAEKMGANQTISKPFKPEEILLLLKTTLNK